MFRTSNLLQNTIAVFSLLVLLIMAGCGDDGDDGPSGTECTTRADCDEGERCDSNGQCTSEALTCTASTDCDFGDYCVDGACQDGDCTTNDDCIDAACRNGTCVDGCTSNDQCPTGEVCNMAVNRCRAEGCTTGSCQDFQVCDSDLSPPTCQFTGECNNDAVCAAYANQLDDGEDYVCSTAQQRCIVKPPCSNDRDCRVNEICEPRASDGRNVCRRGCRETEDCNIGQICDEASLSCRQGCTVDADCPTDGDVCLDLACVPSCSSRSDCSDINAGYICTGTPRVCGACTDDSQCPATEFCDFDQGGTEAEADNPTRGLCVDLPPTCPADAYGDNHDQNDAYQITSFPFDPAEDETPVFCRENSGEWFGFNVPGGNVITIDLEYPEGSGNLDVALLRDNGEELVVSALPPGVDGGTEQIQFGVEFDSNFLVQVRGSVLVQNLEYDLSIDIAPPPACVDDAYEDNDDFANASLLPADTDEVGLQVCGDDPDFYLLEASANQVIQITAAAPVRLGDIDLLLYDEDGTIVEQTSERSDVETLEYVTTGAEDLVLEVRVRNAVGAIDYDLEWTQRDNVCTDVYEPNDTCPAETTVLGSGTYTDLNICSDVDWYTVNLNPLQTVTFRATFDQATAAGDLDITLFGPNDCVTFIESETREQPQEGSTLVTETITYTAESGGQYNLLANLFAGLNVPYTLEIDIQDGPACTDDSFEPNSTADDAVTISATDAAAGNDNVITGLRMCDNDEDWFEIDLVEGDTIEWEIRFDHSEGDLDAFLIGPDQQTIIASGDSTDDDEAVSHTVGTGEDGTYYLRVEAKFSARTQYRLLTTLNGVGTADPDCPDVFENNDTASEAATVAPGSYSLLVCGDPVDDDWFTIDVNAGDLVEIDLLFSHATGNVDLLLFDDRSLTTPVRTAQTNTDNESIVYRSARDQTLTWRVLTTSSTASIPYDMDVTLTAGGTCDDDGFSPNQSSATAASIEAPTNNREGLYPALTKCEDTEDWFEVDLLAGTDFEAYISFDHGDADLNLTVYDPSDNPIGSGGTSTTDNESVEFEVPSDGTYKIQIESVERARVIYDLMLYVDGVGPEDRICPDPYENNDVRGDAASIAVGSFDDLLLCWEGGAGNDQDFYRIFVPEDAELTVNVNFSHDEGDINALLYRGSSLSPVSSGTSTTDNEVVTAVNNDSGENYILRVFGAVSPFTSRYDLDISLNFQTPCADDTLGEPTFSDASGATAITSDAYDALTLCEGTEDWFKLPPSTTSVEANVELNTLLGDLDVQLVDSSQTVVASSSGSDNVETLNEVGLSSAETYYLRVFPRDGAFIRNDYDLWLSVNGQSVSAPFCADPYERNDDRKAAATLNFSSQSVYTDMIACGEDDDWYQLSNLQSNAPGYRVEVFFDHVDNESDLAIDFFDTDGNPASGSGVSTDTQTNDEFTVFSPDSAGTYLMRVTNAAGSTTETPYFMYVDRDRFTSCPEDSFEPNDNFTGDELNAPDLSTIPGTYPLGSCTASAKDDYFSFEVPADGDYTVEVLHNETRLDLGGAIYFEADVGGNIIVASSPLQSVGENRLARTYANAVAGERVGIFVKNNGSTFGFYVLRITVN